MKIILIFLFFFNLASPSSSSSASTNFIFSFTKSNSPWNPSQNLTLLSPNSTFAAGFLSLNTSTPSHVTFSVWYHSNTSDKTAVWSTDPVPASVSLSVNSSGQLFLGNSSGSNLWPNSSLATESANATLRLSELGDLQFGGWSSFNFPTNTFLPNQSLNGTQLISPNRKFQFLGQSNLTFNASDTYFTTTQFQELTLDGMILQTSGGPIMSADFKENRSRRLTLDDDGNLRVYSFYPDRETKWMVVWKAVQEICTIQGLCGTNAICMEQYGSNTLFTCSCPRGYTWASGSNSCVIKTPITNHAKSKFLRLDYVNFTAETIQAATITNYAECESKCRANSTCLGFGYKYDGSQYCSLQLGTRFLNGHWSPGTEAAMFLKVDALETDTSNFTGMTSMLETSCPVRIGLPGPPKASRTEARNIAIVATLFTLELVIGVLSFWAFIKKIALGVARAIAYLHEECLEWVLHCDIKPENILLGDDFCPKVADFGLSKLKKKEQVVTISRIRGTRGYVAPEWVKSEPISSKADVYSFGMVLLEMVTGTRTFAMQDSEMDSSEWYLPRWAYDKVYTQMKIEDVLDNRIKQSYDENVHLKMVDRMVKTAMWCIQEKQEMRPSMGRVAKMLEGTVEIMEPPKPTIFYIDDD
ncbi:hypothetical protein V2J09_015112 [Rumex salicifolius]